MLDADITYSDLPVGFRLSEHRVGVPVLQSATFLCRRNVMGVQRTPAVTAMKAACNLDVAGKILNCLGLRFGK